MIAAADTINDAEAAWSTDLFHAMTRAAADASESWARSISRQSRQSLLLRVAPPTGEEYVLRAVRRGPSLPSGGYGEVVVLRAREIMTRRVVSVQPETSIEYAKTVLTENRFSALPVVDQYNHLVGVVTGADLLREPSRAAPQSRPTTVGAVMTRTPIYMSPTADVNIVAHRMRTYGELRAIPIVDHDFLVGIVTRGDLLRKPPRGGPLGRLLRRVLSRQAVPDPVPYRTRRAGTAARSQYARDVMTTKVVTVGETTPVDVARDRLIRNRFTALPVTDADRRLIGIVSEADLVRDPLDARRTPRPDTVGGAMTTDVVAVESTATVDDLVRLLSDKRLRLVPVVEGGRLVGVVSRGDLL